MQRLNLIICDCLQVHNKIFYPIIAQKEQELGRDVKFNELDDIANEKIRQLTIKKDKIMSDIDKDDYRIVLPKYYVSPNEMSEDNELTK